MMPSQAVGIDGMRYAMEVYAPKVEHICVITVEFSCYSTTKNELFSNQIITPFQDRNIM